MLEYTPNNDLHGDIIPSANGTYALGDSTHRYRRGYINNLYTDYMYPSANSCTIGDTNNPYQCMYMTTVDGYTDYSVVNKGWVKNKIFDVLDWNSLLNVGAPSSQTNYETYNSRHLASYSLLLFVAYDSEIRTSMLIPRSIFVSLTYWVYLNWVNSSNEQFWIECKYKDDTHLTAQCKTNTVGKTLQVYGLNKIY